MNKTGDHFGVQNEHFRFAGDGVFKVLQFIFNYIVQNEYIPSMFKESIIIPIFKGGKKDKFVRKAYRGITLQCILCKLFDSILIKRCDKHIQQRCNISGLQSACKTGVSSLNTAFVLKESLCESLEQGKKSILPFSIPKRHTIPFGLTV